MKNKALRIFSVLLILLLLVSSLASCSSKSYDSESAGNSSSVETGGEILVEKNTTDSNRKIIEKISLNVQTKDFDGFIEKIKEETDELGGYLESTSVDGKTYSDYNDERSAKLVIRVPSENDDEFTEFVSENSYVSHEEITTEDVTLSYVDIQSRLSALKTEKGTLEKLLASAEKLSDVISIQDRLTEVIYEIESYESKLREYDNLVEYTTFTLSVFEVEDETVDEYDTVWQEIGANLKQNFKNVGEFFEGIFVFFVSMTPYLLILIIPFAIAGIVLIIVFKARKKKAKKKENDN